MDKRYSLLKIDVTDTVPFADFFDDDHYVGHDLRRDDIFQKPEDYKMLTEKQMNAILFVVKGTLI